MKYVALLRGINVGGKSQIKMSELKVSCEAIGLKQVRTYINSGNIIFEVDSEDEHVLSKRIEMAILDQFSLPVRVVVYSQKQYARIIAAAPKGWGEKSNWKYNTLFLIPPYDINTILEDIGELKPDLELIHVVDGAIYQSLLFEKFGQTTTGKLASRASYKKMTIRNWNTSQKLLAIIEENNT